MFLKHGAARFLIEDINNPAETYTAESQLPVMFDMVSLNTRDYNHIPGGANVLYQDGHVSFERYGDSDDYPVSRMWATFNVGYVDAMASYAD